MGLHRVVCFELFQNRLMECARGHLANPIDTYRFTYRSHCLPCTKIVKIAYRCSVSC